MTIHRLFPSLTLPSTFGARNPQATHGIRNDSGPPRHRRLLAVLLFAAALGACQGTTQQAPIECDQGVLVNGTCENSPSCNADTDCKEGYRCNTSDHTCYERNYCRPDDSSFSWCGDHAQCINNQCQEYKKCGKHSECADDEYCHTFCLKKKSVCDTLDCSLGGECAPRRSATECVDREGLCSTDNDCAGTRYCSNNYQCSENKCGADNLCESGGVCNKEFGPNSTDGCSNKPNCTTSKECVKGSLCVATSESDPGQCKTASEIKEMCPGNQVAQCEGMTCERKETKQVVQCAANPDGCRRREDCPDNKYCKEGASATDKTTCQPAADVACVDDGINNHTEVTAEPYTQVAQRELTLCSNEDWFSYTPSKEGFLIVRVKVKGLDVGNKTLTLQLYKEGTPLTSASTVISEGNDIYTLTYQLSTVDIGKEFKLKVSGTGEDVRLRYTLSVHVVDSGILNACQNLQVYSFNQNKISHTSKSDLQDAHTSAMSHSCAQDSLGDTPDTIYPFDLTEPSFVRISVTPDQIGGETNPIIALRTECELLDSSCSSNSTNGLPETFSRVLAPGRYYAVVSFTSKDSAGAYNLSITKEAISCNPSENTCDPTTNKASICNESRTGRIEEDCPNGCDSTNTFCNSNPGDACSSAIKVTPSSPQRQLTDFSSLHNSFDPGNACSSSFAKTATSGKDIVFEVEVPSNHVLIAESLAYAVRSIYTSEVCDFSPIQPQCEATALENDATTAKSWASLVWENTSNTTVTRFVVIDYDAKESTPGNLLYDVHVEPKVCEANATRCDSLGRQSITCNKYGTEEPTERHVDCYGRGCNTSSGQCVSPQEDTCSTDAAGPILYDASKVTPGTPITAKGVLKSIADSSENPGNFCGTFNGSTSGKEDISYRIKAKRNEAYTVKVTPESWDSFNPQIWISEQCNANKNEVCLDGANNKGRGGEEEITFMATENKDYWVVLESADGTAGSYSIEVTATATLGTPLKVEACSGNEITYYDKAGLPHTQTCTTCEDNFNTQGRCTDGDGDTCTTAIKLYPNSAGTTSGDASRADFINFSSYMPPFEIAYQTDLCYFGNRVPMGRDIFYQFDLEDGDVVTAIARPGTDAIAFFQKECGKPTSCQEFIYSGGIRYSHHISYKATKKETITLVVKQYENDTKGSLGSLSWKVHKANDMATKKECAPNTQWCESDTQLKMCNEDGNAITEVTCPCKDGQCTLSTTKTTTTCGELPITIFNTSSDPYKEITYYVPQLTGNSKKSVSCVDSSGPEQLFKIDLPAGQKAILTAKIYSLTDTDASLYLLDSQKCEETTPCKGEKTKENYPYGFRSTWIEKIEGPHFLAVDSASSSGKGGPYFLTIQLEKPDPFCGSSYTGPKCEADNSTIKYCHDEIAYTYDCGSRTCNTPGPAGEVICSNYTYGGSSCFQPLNIPQDQLLDNQNLVSAPEGSDRLHIENKINSSCLFPNNEMNKGKEKWYAVSLNEGDTLAYRISHNFGSERDKISSYITKGCGMGEQKCLASTTTLSGEDTIVYRATETGIHYVVVESRANFYFWDIAFQITPASTGQQCIPFKGYCHKTKPNTLVYCNSKKEEIEVECPGGCDGETCVSTISTPEEIKKYDTCDGASDTNTPFVIKQKGSELGAAYSVTIPMTLLSNTIDLDTTEVSSSPGSEAIYKVKLPANARIRTFVTVSSAFEEVSLYYLKASCTEPKSSYLTGITYPPSDKGTFSSDPFSWTNTEQNPVTLYVVVDSKPVASATIPGEQYPKRLYIEADFPNCTYGTDLPRCVNSDQDVQYCPPEGFQKTYTCPNGCGDIGGGEGCKQPSHDTCYDTQVYTLETSHTQANPLEIAGQSFQGATDNYTLLPNNACLKHGQGLGPDRVYGVQIPAGKTLVASAKSAANDDLSIYLSKDCYDIPNQCLVGSELAGEGKEETIEYENTSGSEERRFLVVDSWNGSASEAYELKLWLK